MNSDFSSHAANFGDALETKVDPRTGQFMLNFPVAALIGNQQLGPELSLALSYSPLNGVNYGFGDGFILGTTQFNNRTNLLQLINGEQYRVAPGSDKVRNQKLENFRFRYTNRQDEADGYTVYWKEGKIEKLSKSDDDETFVTTSITSPLGRRLTLTWDWSGQFSRISKVEDESSTLCEIIYDVGMTKIRVWPDTPDFYQLNLDFINDQLDEITRQVSDSKIFNWKFFFDNVGHTQNQLTLTGVDYPTGMRDRVDYNQEEGLQYPESSNRTLKLPCVFTHTRSFGKNQQPESVTQYDYTTQNFLGYNGDFGEWSADSDYIYTTLTDYTYGSTETVVSAGVTIKTERTYNNYHLQIAEEVRRQGNVHRTEMSYYAKKFDFIDQQPAQFQLLKEKKEVFQDKSGSTREMTTVLEFDESGNPTKQIEPDGTITTTTWYSLNGEDGCPAEPNGFVRFMKEQRVIPPCIDGTESEHSTTYKYVKLGATTYVVQESNITFKNAQMLSKESFEYDNASENSTELGRITKITDTLYALDDNSKSYTSAKDFKTTISGNKMTQITTSTGHDGLQTSFSRIQSVYSGRVYSVVSLLGIETNYQYDGLGRLERRTVCPNSEYETTTYWEYGVDKSGPYTIETDAYGNRNRTHFDGAARVINEEIFDAESAKWYEKSSISRNALGEVVSGTTKDWVLHNSIDSDKSFPLKSDITYDGWGNTTEVLLSDGIKQLHHIDPINLTKTTSTQGTIGISASSTGSVITTHDKKSQLLVNKITKTVTGEEYTNCRYTWNGLRQLIEEYDELGGKTERTYDEYGRVKTQKSPDGTIVSRTYAPHLTGNYIASISVTGLDSNGSSRTWLLGTQTFDSIGRLKESVCGNRTVLYSYEGASLKPSTVTLPSGKIVTYTYIPELSYAVSSINCDGVSQQFNYDKKSGELVKAIEADSEISNTWSLMGELKEETFLLSGQSRSAKHAYSLNGAPVTYTDVTGKQTTYSMDSNGRVDRIMDDSLLVDLTYDSLGRLQSQTVRDKVSASTLTNTLSYDNFGREITRTITNDKGLTLELSQTWQKNNLLAMRTTNKNGINVREEEFAYDNRNRLLSYSATGDSLPVDAYGEQMLAQTYRYDALNNITSVVTTLSDRSTDTGKFFYNNADDPTQLSKVTHTHKKYPETINLSYDIEGRMTLDEAGRTLAYDTLGRLMSVSENNISKGTYSYDALNRMITQNAGGRDIRELYYRGSELVNEVVKTQKQETRFIKSGHTCLGVSDVSGLTLTAADQNDSLLWSSGTNAANEDGLLHIWSPYGSGKSDNRLPGFNGERVDPVSGTYHLGNGYRAYNPVLMRFNCPDSLSPFGAGGINPYAYCAGDPVNHVDPSGHLSWQSIVGIVAGVIGIALAVFTAGASIAAAGGVMAAIGSASVTSLIVGGLGVVSDITGIVSGALEDANPQASETLGWVSLATGLVGLVSGAVSGAFKGVKSLRGASKSKMNAPVLGGGANSEMKVLNGETRTPKWYAIEHKGKLIYGADQEVTDLHVRAIVNQINRDMQNGTIARKPIVVLSGTHGTPAGMNWTANARTQRLLEYKFYLEDLPLKRTRQVATIYDTASTSKSAYTRMLKSDRSHVVFGFCFGRNEQTLRELLNLPVVQTYGWTFTDDIFKGNIIPSNSNSYYWTWAPHELS